jgi:hypothetical protein
MKSILLIFVATGFAMASGFAEEVIKFPSPDGKFALSMGSWLTNHFDSTSSGWVTDSAAKPGAIIELKSHKVVVEFETPLRENEDKAIWNADSKRLALNHLGNRTTEMKVYFWDEGSFQEVELPELPEIQLKMSPSRNPDAHSTVHFDYDKVTPLRWLKSGALVVSRERSETDTTEQEVTYSRRYIITIGFNAKHEASVQDVMKQKQKVSK